MIHRTLMRRQHDHWSLTRRESLKLIAGSVVMLGSADKLLADPNAGSGQLQSDPPIHTSHNGFISPFSTGLGGTTFTYRTALEPEKNITRRDPSDIISYKGEYYVWYTKVVKSSWRDHNGGYAGDVWYATSKDGFQFKEQGRAIARGGSGRWDQHGVFTPNILVWQKRFYLYYTGVPSPFSRQTRTAIGMASADSPAGPWHKCPTNPLLLPQVDHLAAFDSMRVDDSAFVVRGHDIMLYYKGRCLLDGRAGPARTHMGVAVARQPSGPFIKSQANPLVRGHEVLVWPQAHGVGTMVTNMGPRWIYFAPDGLHFKAHNPIIGAPAAPGIFRADNFRPNLNAKVPRWGISMGQHDNDIYLLRFDIHYHNPPARRGKAG